MKKEYNIETYDTTEKFHLDIIKQCNVLSPTISIIIRCKNEEDKIKECLDMIFKQNINEVFEVVIVDSGSNDNTLNIVNNYNVSIYSIPSIEFNFGSSVQLGIKISRGKYCVFISGHCIPSNDSWLKNLIGEFDNNTAAVYGKQTYYEDTYFIEKEALDNTFGNYEKTQKWDKKFKLYKDYKNEIIFSNANSCIKKDVANNVKFKKIIASEDREWACRVLKKGYNIKYAPKAIVYHAHNETKEKYYKRILINSKALKEFAGVKINIIHVFPLYFLYLFKDIKYLISHRLFNISNINIAIIYRYLYVKAHYKGSR